MQFLYSLALLGKRWRAVSGAWVWSMSAGSRCWQQTAARLSEGLWACSSLYEEIKSVKCHGLIKAGGDFCHPVSCAVLIQKTRWKCRLSALFGFVQKKSEKKPTTDSSNGWTGSESPSAAFCDQRSTSCVCLGGLIFASKTHMLPTCACREWKPSLWPGEGLVLLSI